MSTSTNAPLIIVLPEHLAAELQSLVPPREREIFVTRAVEHELRRLRLQAALEASAGAWQDTDHPELNDGPAIDRWIAEGRSQLAWDRSLGA